MIRRHAIAIILLAAAVVAAQEAASDETSLGFTPPQAYPASRYEAAWAKNPFTLKTAPEPVESVSFAKDLAIGSHYGDRENPTVVIVNTKTNERTRLRKGETAPNGMRILSVRLGETRKQTTVEVALGSETRELSYNAEYLTQMASNQNARTAPGVRIPGTGMPGAATPGLQNQVRPGMPTAPGNVQPRIQLPNAAPGAMRPSSGNAAAANGGSMLGRNVAIGAVNAASNSGTAQINLNAGTTNAPQTTPTINNSGVADASGNMPTVPVRRRLISSPGNY